MAERLEVLIAGGGVAALEAALALHHLAAAETHLTLVAPDPEFELKPLAVEEPFGGGPAQRHDLAAVLAELGGSFVDGALAEVDPARREIKVGFGKTLSYDRLIVAAGARSIPCFTGAETFWSNRSDLPVDELIGRAGRATPATLTLVVPPGMTWPLPLYELALLIRARSEAIGAGEIGIELLTPEPVPLGVFGDVPAAAVADLLDSRRIEVSPGTHVEQGEPDGPLRVEGCDRGLDPALVVALPRLRGPFFGGLPADPDGFIPVDELGRVEGVPHVYAAGDCTTYPLKQGGLATQQADAIAEHIVVELGLLEIAHPFEPVLRAQLFTGSESLFMRHELGAGRGDGEASSDYLWWPPKKIAGRYLSAWLGGGDIPGLDLGERTVDVEAGLPHEWHSEPL
jgi:sulfide:quinone oxidoreductase